MSQTSTDDAARRAHLERFERDERPVLEALDEAGLHVRDLPELVNRRDLDYVAQVPILIEWLPRVQYAPVKETIARALTIRAARPVAAPVLLEELRRAPEERPAVPDDAPLEEKWRASQARMLRGALGNALAFTADRSYFDTIVELIDDPRTGEARAWLVEYYMGRFRDLADRAVPVLRRLLGDDDLGRYALKPLGQLRAVEARAEIERFLGHEQDWVRTDAKRALAKLDKAG